MPLTVSELSQEERDRVQKILTPRLTKYIPHVPYAKQAAFLLLTCREAFYGGAAGGGKSDSLLMAALQYVDIPGYAAILFRRTYAELTLPEALMDRASEWLAPFIKTKEVHWAQDEKTYSFPSGATLSFGYLDTGKDHLRYQCFHPNTEMLTKTGWKNIKDIVSKEQVATVNPKTSVMEYKPVTNTFIYNCDDTLLELYQRHGVSFCVTKNHKIFADTRRNHTIRSFEANKLPKNARIPQTVIWKGMSPKEDSIKFESEGHNGRTIMFPIKSWFSFLGWYLAEGNVSHPRNHGYTIAISQQNIKGRKIIESLLNTTNINYSNEPKVFRFQNKALYTYLKLLGKSNDKYIPRDWLDYDKEYLELMLESLVEGDGTWRNDTKLKCGHFVTSSNQLKDDFMELAIKCGYRVTQDLRQGNKSDSPYGIKPRWHVAICKTSKPALIAKGLTEVKYQGKVYCVEVPPYNSVIIRYKNRVCWIGQSSAFQFIAFDELTHFEQSDYKYLFSRLRRTREMKENNIPIRIRSGSNPGGPGHDWVKKRFLTDGPAKGRIFIPADMYDNIYLDTEDYLESLNELDPLEREQLLKGDWAITGGGKIIKRQWFIIVDILPSTQVYIPRVRYWDLAATDANVSKAYGYKPAYTVGLKMCKIGRDFYIEDIKRFQKTPDDVEKEILATAIADGRNVEIWMEEEPGSSGKNTINYYQKVLSKFTFRGQKESGSKILRANATASTAGQGRIKLINGIWNNDFLDEVDFFPEGKIKDQVDAFSGAFDKLNHFASYNVLPTAVGNEEKSYWAMN